MKAMLETTFPEENEQKAIHTWYIGLDAFVSKASDISTFKPPTEISQYQNILDTVNWGFFSDMEEYYAALHGSGHKTIAEPIYLGQDDPVLYYLSPRQVFPDTSEDPKEDADVHAYILEMRPVTGGFAPFRFGFWLGDLEFVYDSIY